jgi:hypothetical protein
VNVDETDLTKAIYGSEFIPLIPLLLEGISKEKLEEEIARIKNVPITHASVSITRMNIAGGLRSWGYLVSGGRQGRNQPYKVTGWVTKAEKTIASQWQGQARDRLKWIESLTPFVETDEERVRNALANRPSSDMLHECAFMYMYCYELARDRAWWVDDHMLVMARFYSYPRFRVFNLDATVPELLSVAKYIAPASVKPVYIVNPSLKQLKDIKRGDPGGSFGKRLQAVYRIEDIAQHPDVFFNSRSLEQLRSNSRQMQYTDVSVSKDQLKIISEWKRINEGKMRQLAITRDIVAVNAKTSKKITLTGYREGKPACLHILDPLSNRPDTIAQIVEKSLNYKTQEGGRPGTADYNLVMTCRYLLERGYKYLACGGFDGGGVGLPQHKRKFAKIEDDIASQAFYTSYDYHRYDAYSDTQLPTIGE